jgi:hypothetical protein
MENEYQGSNNNRVVYRYNSCILVFRLEIQSSKFLRKSNLNEIRDRPFNLQEGGMVFSKKIFRFPMLLK